MVLTGKRRIRRALLSVTDKTGLVEFAKTLAAAGAELVSTGGTARAMREAGLPTRDVADLTGFPEMLEGRVKTLHPKVHGGILQIRDNEEHRAAAALHGIEPIDMVVVNLYPFQQTARKPAVKFGDLIENIDIGGPSMVRSAAKNFEDVAVVTSPETYQALMRELLEHDGALSLETRWRLAKQAFGMTAAYDSGIAAVLEKVASPPVHDALACFRADDEVSLPHVLNISYPKVMDLRYGENPHQKAALYGDGTGSGIAGARQIQGKELSFNNLVDLDAAWQLVGEFSDPAVAIIKHTNPAGAAIGASIADAYKKALAADPLSAFGSVLGINREVDGEAAELIVHLFVEAIAAPSFSSEAMEHFKSKKNLRLLEVKEFRAKSVVKQISGGLLLQDPDLGRVEAEGLKLVTKRTPSEGEIRSLLFAWRVAKHVKSNAIVYARDGQTLGIGAGQMSRVDAAKFGAMKAVLPLAGSVAASDAFFPFPDGLEAVAEAGATAAIQPGGSVNDEKVIDRANSLGIAMVFTGTRHFRH